MSNVDILLNIFTSVGLDINKKDEYGNTPFMHAVMDGNIFLVSSLINFGIDVNIQNNDGKTPLMEVIESDFDTEDLEYWKIVMRIMLLLINAGANTNIQDKYRKTALIKTAEHGDKYSVEMTQLLLSAGANPNMQDTLGNTALMISAENGCDESNKIIHMLVSLGADIFMKNHVNETAFDIALKNKNDSTMKILQKFKDNWIFNPKLDIQLQYKFWNIQNIQSVRNIYTSWKGDKHQQSGFGKLPWDLIRDIILPMTIDRRDTIKLIKKEEEKKISSRPCKRAKIH